MGDKGNGAERVKTEAVAQVTCRLHVTGMDCGDCAKTVAQSLRSLPGVAETAVNFVRGTADVTYDPARVDLETFTRRITALGYGVAAQPSASPVRETTWTFDVRGMDCGDCAQTVQAGVARLPGVREARVNFAVGTLVLIADPTETTPEAVIHAVAAAGYTATVRGAAVAPPAAQSGWWRQRRARELGAAALLWLIGFVVERAGAPRMASAVPFTAGMLLSGYPVARAGWFALRARRADMNLLMIVAAVGAVVIGQWDEGASVLILFGIGTLLQAQTVERTRQEIAGLLAIAPAEANRLHDDHEHRVPVAQVKVGDRVRVRPGERLPVDGIIVAGQSAVDQAPITGESIPVEVQEGSAVFAGSVNGEGTIDVRATKPAHDTTLARIVALVEEAQASRAPAQAFVDRFAAIYTPLVILGAVLVAVVPPLIAGGWGGWVYKALVLLVIACPCALVISTPVALMAAIGAASRRGVLFKGGAALEALAAVRAVAFDKTGTLTAGQPAVLAVHTCDGAADDVLRIAAALEGQSEHPLARAVVTYGREERVEGLTVSEYRAVPGRGGSGMVNGAPASVGSVRWFTERGLWDVAGHEQYLQEGNGVVCVERAGQMIGLLTLRDAVRPESARAVAALRALVGSVVMLTGDNARTAARIATTTGVTDVRADLLPADKAAAVRALAADGPVAMVGDGINDAPALATASVGVAMGAAGTDVAIEAADVALMGDDLSRLPYAIRLARRTLRIIRQNIAASLIVKALFLALTVVGITNLWLAVFADMGISLLVTANALRVLRTPEKTNSDGA